MSSKAAIPDAWDDDWEKAADKPDEPDSAGPAPKLTRAEKRARHVEVQKQLWDSADSPGRFNWLDAQGAVPLKQDFEAPKTLLTRKPKAPVIARREAADGIGKLSLEDDDDSETERQRRREADAEERTRKAIIDRAEKEKRYAEARERIMGSGAHSPVPSSRESSHGRDIRRPRGNKTSNTSHTNNRRSQPQSPGEQSPAYATTDSGTLLFDPDDMGRRLTPKRDGVTTPREDEPVRQPRGPDNSGRGGFGFVARGGKASA